MLSIPIIASGELYLIGCPPFLFVQRATKEGSLPYKPPKPCSHPGCPLLVHERYCEQHGKQEQQQYDQQRGSAHQRGYTARWGRIRKLFLMENPLCIDCQQEGRAEPATVAHHRIPKDQEGSDRFDNLDPLCVHHHKEKHKHERWGEKMGFQVPVNLVCGPPGSGKNHYIKKYFQYGDLIVDMDLLYQACSNLAQYEKPDDLLPFVCEARDAIINRLQRPSKIKKAWIITANPTKRDHFRQLGARVIVIDAPLSECRSRMRSRPINTQNWNDLIASWEKKYLPDERDIIIKNG